MAKNTEVQIIVDRFEIFESQKICEILMIGWQLSGLRGVERLNGITKDKMKKFKNEETQI